MSEVLGMRIRHGMKYHKYWTCKSDIYETSLVLGMRTTREIFFKGTGHACVSDVPIRGTGHAWQMQNKYQGYEALIFDMELKDSTTGSSISHVNEHQTYGGCVSNVE